MILFYYEGLQLQPVSSCSECGYVQVQVNGYVKAYSYQDALQRLSKTGVQVFVLQEARY